MASPSEPPEGPQKGLFDEDPVVGHGKAPTRRKNPETSHEAGRVLEGSGEATRREREVFDAVADAGAHGLTTWEFGQREGIEREGYSGRFSGLKDKGLIAVQGKRRRPDGSGRFSEIHVLPKYVDQDPEPPANSPEDLGMVSPAPAGQVYGKPAPEPDPLPENFARSAMQHADAVKFRDWIFDQDVPTHARVTLGGIVVGLSGLGREDLRWLCQAILQAGRAPSPGVMRRAVLTHDVSVLREEELDD